MRAACLGSTAVAEVLALSDRREGGGRKRGAVQPIALGSPLYPQAREGPHTLSLGAETGPRVVAGRTARGKISPCRTSALPLSRMPVIAVPRRRPSLYQSLWRGRGGPLTLEIDLTSEEWQGAPSVAYRHALGSRVMGVLMPRRHAEARARLAGRTAGIHKNCGQGCGWRRGIAHLFRQDWAGCGVAVFGGDLGRGGRAGPYATLYGDDGSRLLTPRRAAESGVCAHAQRKLVESIEAISTVRRPRPQG